jgi:Zn-dependent protease/predicted transcriptional regulator
VNSNLTVARILGIPIVVNISWLITLAFVTSMLALKFYPEVLPPSSRYRDDVVLHWIMALVSGLIFFLSILLHELAHSVVARKQGIPVKNITLFIFGGVSQIGGEARRPLHEFVMAIIGPLTSLVLGGFFFALWWLNGHKSTEPIGIVLEWLFFMNIVVAAFNMAPGFPMDGGRVLRSLIWGVTGNLYRATKLATFVGRSLGYTLVAIGGIAFFGVFEFIDPWSGAWFAILGLFLESSARHSWFQARALDHLSRYKAEDLMTPDLATASLEDEVRYLLNRGGPRFIFFVSDDDEKVVGVLTEKQTVGMSEPRSTARDLMVESDVFPVAEPKEDAASMLQRMEAESIWHLPVVAEGRVVGVVNKESLLRLLAGRFFRRPGQASAAG